MSENPKTIPTVIRDLSLNIFLYSPVVKIFINIKMLNKITKA